MDDRLDLFRKQVLDSSAKRYGSTLPKSSVPIILTVCVSVVTFSFIVLFFSMGEYLRVETMYGELVYDQKATPISLPTDGIVREIFVSEGASIADGMPILQFSRHVDAADTLVFSDTLGSEWEERLKALEESTEESVRQNSIEINLAEIRIATLDRELELARRKVSLIQTQIDDADRELENTKQLRIEGFLSDSNVQVLQKEYHRLEGELIEAERAVTNLEWQRDQAILNHEIQTSKLDLTRSIYSERLALARNELTQDRANYHSLITSPISGIVSSVTVETGQPTKANEVLLYIIPNDAKLIGRVWIPTSDTASVNPGDSIDIHYRGFPYQRFGIATGIVSTVSNVPRTRITPLGERKHYFADIDIPSSSISSGSKTYALKSGMELEAKIVVEHVPIYQWILSPLYGNPRSQ